MGRTTPTFRERLRRFEAEWGPYRRALRAEAQPHFDALLAGAERYAGAAGHQNPAHAHRAILLSMLLAQEADRAALAARVEALEARLDDAV